MFIYTKVCAGCYAVSTRLDAFVRSAAGRARVHQALDEANAAQAQQAGDRLVAIAAQGLAKYEAAGWPELFKTLQRRRTECCGAPVRVEFQGRCAPGYTMREMCEQCGRPSK